MKTLSPLNDSALLNETLEYCTLLNQTEEGFIFSCVEYNPWFASLTLTFIYLPSLNVLATMYGPKKAGALGIVWGAVMFGLSFIFLFVSVIATNIWYVMGWFLVFLGGGMTFLALTIDESANLSLTYFRFIFSFFSNSDSLLSCLLFPLLLPLSPITFVCLKLISLLKPNNKLLKAQSKMGSRGESILESAPQLALQCYIVLLSLSPTSSQWFSLITSALSLCPANIEYYVTACLEEKKRMKKKPVDTFGPMSILKNIAVFLPISLFRILAGSILCVLFNVFAIAIIVGYMLVLFVCLGITDRCYNLIGEKDAGDNHNSLNVSS